MPVYGTPLTGQQQQMPLFARQSALDAQQAAERLNTMTGTVGGIREAETEAQGSLATGVLNNLDKLNDTVGGVNSSAMADSLIRQVYGNGAGLPSLSGNNMFAGTRDVQRLSLADADIMKTMAEAESNMKDRRLPAGMYDEATPFQQGAPQDYISYDDQTGRVNANNAGRYAKAILNAGRADTPYGYVFDETTNTVIPINDRDMYIDLEMRPEDLRPGQRLVRTLPTDPNTRQVTTTNRPAIPNISAPTTVQSPVPGPQGTSQSPAPAPAPTPAPQPQAPVPDISQVPTGNEEQRVTLQNFADQTRMTPTAIRPLTDSGDYVITTDDDRKFTYDNTGKIREVRRNE